MNLSLVQGRYRVYRQHPVVWIGLLFILLSVLLPGLSGAQGLQLTSEKQFEYADSLFIQKDYSSAQNEFKRFIYFFPDDKRIPEARLKIGLSYFYVKDYENAYQQFSSIIKTYGPDDIGLQSGMFISRCYMMLKDYQSAILNLNSLIEMTDNDQWRDKIYYFLGWIYVESADFRNAQISFGKIKHTENLELKSDSIAQEIDEYKQIPFKSPVVAGVLSIIPGGGYFYCNRYQDALISFVINGICAAAAYESFDKDLNVIGGVISAAGIGFYGGNIYGGISSAHKYNKIETKNFIETLKNRFSINFTANGDSVGIVLGIH